MQPIGREGAWEEGGSDGEKVHGRSEGRREGVRKGGSDGEKVHGRVED